MIKNYNRQSVTAAVAVITAEALADGMMQAAVELPAGAVVVGGFVVVDTAFDSSDAATLQVGDDVLSTRYGSPNMKALGKTDLTITGYEVPIQSDINITYTGDLPVNGRARLIVEYIVNKRAEFTQG